ncbi:probable low-specificity L-threonine aldolase 2 isoform X2 [Pararge aegeria]|uniref:probable low-specificity L-threonine aldolase 2 isoform X2 n=1 Tax=Pararge aegeria TaxID=116150 RepID=UPI0019CF74EF|nr:probable low-specificity L-threonine aldolase 2 isoform X2 [Pararge aegeria]
MAYIVDLRSDTVTKPTESMKHAMVNSAVGDDVFGEDPTVNALESKVANLLGKQAALFVPSGTMANLIAIMVHCNKRGSEAIVGNLAHIYKYEQGGAAHVAGVLLSTVQNKPDGTFDLQEVENRIRGSDIHEPITSMVAIENTHNVCGGKVLPLQWIDELSELCKRHSIPLHMDGARLLNASAYLEVPAERIVRGCDSVALCFSKGLSAPVGSAIVGSCHFIQQARRMRKMLGGGMRQSGVLAAAAIVALDEIAPKLALDHKRAQRLGKGRLQDTGRRGRNREGDLLQRQDDPPDSAHRDIRQRPLARHYEDHLRVQGARGRASADQLVHTNTRHESWSCMFSSYHSTSIYLYVPLVCDLQIKFVLDRDRKLLFF